jgi:hypothetical protein
MDGAMTPVDAEGPSGGPAEPADGTVSATAAGTPGERSDGVPGLRHVAILLAVAAALAAILAARGAMLSSSAGDAWQATLALELMRAESALIDIGSVVGVEAEQGVIVRVEEIVAQELRAAAASAAPEVATALQAEARLHEDVAADLATDYVFGTDYRRADGGLDIEQRLADVRAQYPELVAVDPDITAARGERAFDHASRTIGAGLPLGIAILAGAMAMSVTRRRRSLLVVGWGAVGIALVMALAVEAWA